MPVNLTTVTSSMYAVIDELGVPITWNQAKPPKQTASFKVGFKHAGKQDIGVVNDYGIAAVIITAKASDFPVAPQKFDDIVLNGETYTLEAVHPIHINGTLALYKCYSRGK